MRDGLPQLHVGDGRDEGRELSGDGAGRLHAAAGSHHDHGRGGHAGERGRGTTYLVLEYQMIMLNRLKMCNTDTLHARTYKFGK